MKIAAATKNPQRLLGLHIVNALLVAYLLSAIRMAEADRRGKKSGKGFYTY